MFEIIFHPAAEHEVYKLDPVMQAKALKGLEKLEAQGPYLRYPHTVAVTEKLFELRVGAKDISRTLFAFAAGRRIYILRTWIKKTPKTPQSEIVLALARLKELTDES